MPREHTLEYLKAVYRRLREAGYPPFMIDPIFARARGEAGGKRRKPKQQPTPQEGETDGAGAEDDAEREGNPGDDGAGATGGEPGPAAA